MYICKCMYEYIFIQCMCSTVYTYIYSLYDVMLLRGSRLTDHGTDWHDHIHYDKSVHVHLMYILCRYVMPYIPCTNVVVQMYKTLFLMYVYMFFSCTCSYSPDYLYTIHIVCHQIRWYIHYNSVFLHKWSHYLYIKQYNSITDDWTLVCGFLHLWGCTNQVEIDLYS